MLRAGDRIGTGERANNTREESRAPAVELIQKKLSQAKLRMQQSSKYVILMGLNGILDFKTPNPNCKACGPAVWILEKNLRV